MTPDIRLFRRSTLLALHPDDPTWEEAINGLEVVDPETGPDGRFQMVPAGSGIPLMLPSCSFFNRSVDEPWFIFTPGEVDEGAVYIGRSDFHALAETAGYIPIQKAARVNEENQRLKHDLGIALGLINDLRNSIAGLVGAEAMVRSAESKSVKRSEPRSSKSANSDLESRTDDDLVADLEFGD